MVLYFLYYMPLQDGGNDPSCPSIWQVVTSVLDEQQLSFGPFILLRELMPLNVVKMYYTYDNPYPDDRHFDCLPEVKGQAETFSNDWGCKTKITYGGNPIGRITQMAVKQVFVCLSVCLLVYLFVCLFVCFFLASTWFSLGWNIL